MADIPFQIGGQNVPCPDYAKSKFDELGDIAYQYLDGSPVYLGMPSITYVWSVITTENAQIIRLIYDTLVTGISLSSTSGTPISLTIPDYYHGGLRVSTAYMMEPTGTAGGDITTNFTVVFYNISEAALQTALASPGGSHWDGAANGFNLKIGGAGYSHMGWQFG